MHLYLGTNWKYGTEETATHSAAQLPLELVFKLAKKKHAHLHLNWRFAGTYAYKGAGEGGG